MSYKIKTNTFEGPFDLLVYLIERAEMNIYDIKISVITGQYLAHIKEMNESNVTVGSEFMVLAATLIELKSKMLLPRITLEGETLEDPRTDLVQKILEYTKFKKLASALEDQREFARLKIEKPQEDLLPYTGDPDVYLVMDMNNFIASFRNFIHKKIKSEELHKMHSRIEREKITLENKVGTIKKLLTSAKTRFMKFTELLSPKADRYDKVVTFIAILDLIKEGNLKATQKHNFDDIEVQLVESEGN